VSNDFFSLWLGKRMLYSCAYFATPSDDLDTAQERKLDYVCRKLRLRPGERLLDIGCGWGGLLIYAASKYGVHAVGITLSRPQADLAMDWVRREGLSDRCQVLVKDYREVSELGMFDKLVSIGMFEHVGESRLPEYFERAWEVLNPGGVFLNHGIAQMVSMAPRKGPSFSERYVFPDGELLPISMTLRIAEEKGFEVRDVESLREHYTLTIRHWIRRLEARREEARSVTDETTYRVWRLFMSGTAHQFDCCETNVYQALFVKPHQGKSGFPLTRNDWYQ
jgi:cyclopropane-fatty-acyl-phospholipid synthase